MRPRAGAASPSRAADDDGPTPPRSRRVQVIAALSLVGGLGIVALVFLGRANSQRYLLTCSTDRVTPEQGRSFPPWGSHPLAGPEWKPIVLPANAECTEHETDNPAELERLYSICSSIARARRSPARRCSIGPPAAACRRPLDAVSAQLTQALLLSRSPDRRDQRKEVERLMGDVTYWRAIGPAARCVGGARRCREAVRGGRRAAPASCHRCRRVGLVPAPALRRAPRRAPAERRPRLGGDRPTQRPRARRMRRWAARFPSSRRPTKAAPHASRARCRRAERRRAAVAVCAGAATSWRIGAE